MRIVIVSTLHPPENGGGIATYSRNLAESLVTLGHHVRVICQTKELERVEKISGVEIHRFRHRHLPLLERWLPGLAWSIFVRSKLMEWQKTDPFDIVEFPNWEGVGLATAVLPHTFPVITRLHTPYFESLNISANSRLNFSDRFICWMEKKAVLKSDALTTSTVNHASMMAGNYRIEAASIAIIPLGIQLPELAKKRIRSATEIPVKILYVSRLELRKGTLTLLQAIPNVLEKIPDAELTLIGQDRPHAPGNRLFKEYFHATYPQLVSKVRFLGFQPETALASAYANCDVFVVPSKYESFGLIYLEAMAWGKPVIGCHTGGIPEVIKTPDTGFLTPPDNHEELAKKLEILCLDANLRTKMGVAARNWVEERFDRLVMAEASIRVYEKTAPVKPSD